MTENKPLRITWDDIKSPQVDSELQRQQPAQLSPTVTVGAKTYPPPRQYGSLPTTNTIAPKRGMLSTPCYTGLAGAVGALMGWGITELVLSDSSIRNSEDVLVHTTIWFALIGAAIGATIGSIEGIMSRASEKALKGGAIGLGVGILGCAIGGLVAQIVYSAILQSTDDISMGSLMTARIIGWGVAGSFLGLGQGVAMGSGKKILNGLLGGLGGGLVGGLLFDPICMAVKSDVVSRLIGLTLIGAAAGVLMGWVEQWLKDAWLHVATGPLTGKQFVIYKNPTLIGSSPKCDIYLFKDVAIEPRHAAISNDGRAYVIQDAGTTSGIFVNGRRVQQQRLQMGDRIQVGGTCFTYSEKAARRLGAHTTG